MCEAAASRVGGPQGSREEGEREKGTSISTQSRSALPGRGTSMADKGRAAMAAASLFTSNGFSRVYSSFFKTKNKYYHSTPYF